ncbi:hypothetical protein PLESTB_000224500 [Pleodorina starrii]|uniref:Uncharacterized protein n=1 Tax=Pleodorina starrii TaxID=330485 RepID=A0A9W6BCH6_9CHLO|nr:hypothetical protein PLESTB_000224500 [Pleodorina starrii]
MRCLAVHTGGLVATEAVGSANSWIHGGLPDRIDPDNEPFFRMAPRGLRALGFVLRAAGRRGGPLGAGAELRLAGWLAG